jgi:hypothetical protein
MEWTQKVSLNKDVLMQDLGGEAVFLHCEQEEYFSLDQVGTRMLAVLQDASSIQAAYEMLLEEYDVEPERLKQELLEFVEKLVEDGLVEVADS